MCYRDSTRVFFKGRSACSICTEKRAVETSHTAYARAKFCQIFMSCSQSLNQDGVAHNYKIYLTVANAKLREQLLPLRFTAIEVPQWATVTAAKPEQTVADLADPFPP